jgi:hypothetical protein
MRQPFGISLRLIEPFNYLKMTWPHHIDDIEVKMAFQKIAEVLEQASEPLYVVVDVRQNPRFPLKATLAEARSVHVHPRLRGWLVIGSNWLARAIDRTLSSLTRRKSVQWFDSEDAVIAYLQAEQDRTL